MDFVESLKQGNFSSIQVVKLSNMHNIALFWFEFFVLQIECKGNNRGAWSDLTSPILAKAQEDDSSNNN